MFSNDLFNRVLRVPGCCASVALLSLPQVLGNAFDIL